MIITDDFVVLNLPKTGSTFVRTVLKKVHQARLERRPISERLAQGLGLRKRPFFQELMLANIMVKSANGRPHQHGAWIQIPKAHRHKPIVSVMRNPYERLVSSYEFRWWVKVPPIPEEELRVHLPSFPDLTLSEFMQLRDLEVRHSRIPPVPPGTDVGLQTVQFIQMFFKDPFGILPVLDDDYLDSDRFLDDMAPVSFLRTEQLNADLHSFLLNNGFSGEEAGLVVEHEKVRVTERRNRDSAELWTDDIIHRVQRTERLLFRVLEQHGLTYEAPEVAGAGLSN